MRVLALALLLAPLPAFACGMPAYKRLDVALADVDAAMEAPRAAVPADTAQAKPAEAKPVQAAPAEPKAAEQKPSAIPEVAQAEPRS